MPRSAVLLAEGFEEIEAITVLDVMRRAGIEVEGLGVESMRVCGAHGIEMVADALLESVEGHWDAVILPGGMPGASNLRDSQVVQNFLRTQAGNGSLLAAICAAPIALAAGGFLQGRRATCYPGFEPQLHGAYIDSAPVVVDQGVITSQGPSTALAFALTIVENLVGPAQAGSLAQQMLVAPVQPNSP